MWEKIISDKINKEFAGKELMFCEKIYTDIMFSPENIRTCCFSTQMPYNPPVLFEKVFERFDKAEYFYKIYEFMKKNQGEQAPCKGCRFFKKTVVPEFKAENRLEFIVINHFIKCNCECIYCAYSNIVNTPAAEKTYRLFPIAEQLIKEKQISPSCLINWGGGEPLLCGEFTELVRLFHEHKIRQAVNSSGVIFSQDVLNGMKDNSMSIQISPDSGDSEQYFKIKKRHYFDVVWENIAKYAQYPDMLFVKYIFFSYTADEKQVRLFIDNCVKAGVKNIVIDCESKSVNNPECEFGGINADIVNLAVLMKHLAAENNIKYQISYQWKEEHRKFIENN